MNNQEIIKVEDLTRNYRMIYAENPEDREIKVLKGLNFAVKTEEFVGIMGKSGCGKTTLLKVLGLIVNQPMVHCISMAWIRENCGATSLLISAEEKWDLYFRIFICLTVFR